MLSFLQKHPQLLRHLHKNGDQPQKNVQRAMLVLYIANYPAKDGIGKGNMILDTHKILQEKLNDEHQKLK